MKIKEFLVIIGWVFIIIALAVAIGVAFEYGKDKYVEKDLGQSVNTDPIVLTASSTLTTASAEYDGTSEAKPALLGTSTVASMQDPITKTIEIGNDVDEFCQNIYFQASTTDAVLEWTYSFSDDGTNWYMQDDNQLVSSGVVTHGAGTTTHKWTPAVTDALARQDCVNVNAKHIKIEYTRTANLSGGKLFSEGWTRTDY